MIFSLGCFQARKQVHFIHSLLKYGVKFLPNFCPLSAFQWCKTAPLGPPGGFKVFKLKIHRHIWTFDIFPSTLNILLSTLNPRQKPTLPFKALSCCHGNGYILQVLLDNSVKHMSILRLHS